MIKRIIIAAWFIATMSACMKDAGFRYTDVSKRVQVSLLSTDLNLRLHVFINDTEVSDSLANRWDAFGLVTTDSIHLLLRDHSTNAVVADTVLPSPSNKQVNVKLLKLSADGPLMMVAGGDGNNLPPDRKRIAVLYNGTHDLPAGIAIEVYKTNLDPNTYELLHTDTVGRIKMEKGKVSDFLEIPYTTDPNVIYFYQPVNEVTGRPAEGSTMPFDGVTFSPVFFYIDLSMQETATNVIFDMYMDSGPAGFAFLSTQIIAY